MGGHVEGEYTVADALSWALDDVRTGRARPQQIAAAGRVVYDQAAIGRLAAGRHTAHIADGAIVWS